MKARCRQNGLLRWAVFIVLLSLLGHHASAAAPLEIRVGVLKFGTVNWELETLKHNGLDSANGFRLVSKPFASPRACNSARRPTSRGRVATTSLPQVSNGTPRRRQNASRASLPSTQSRALSDPGR